MYVGIVQQQQQHVVLRNYLIFELSLKFAVRSVTVRNSRSFFSRIKRDYVV